MRDIDAFQKMQRKEWKHCEDSLLWTKWRFDDGSSHQTNKRGCWRKWAWVGIHWFVAPQVGAQLF
jgi:hypothetical protein